VAPAGQAQAGNDSTNVTVLIDDLDIRVLDRDTGALIRKLVSTRPATTNPAASNAETHPKTGCRSKPCLGTPVNDVPIHDTGRSRTILVEQIVAEETEQYFCG
jgi:hypothetical protein